MPDCAWFAWAMEHHQEIKSEILHRNLEEVPKEKERIDPAQHVVPRKQNVQENAQHVEGVRTRPSLVSIPNHLNPAG